MPTLVADVGTLQSADVVVLNEVDWGMPRSDYREVIGELGQALDMNWAYGVEFVEIDPVVLGTEAFDDIDDEQAQAQFLERLEVDRDRLRALHGTAILSRYPIRRAELKPFEHRAYDWFNEEKQLRPTKRGIRAGARVIGEDMHREMRRGGRTTLYVHLDVPDLPGGQLTVASPHLENRAEPKDRRRQLEEVFEQVRAIQHPVVIAGDLNTTGGNGEAFKLERELYNKYTTADTYVNSAIQTATGLGLAYDVLRIGFRFSNNVSDPTVRGIRFFAPNKEHGLFDAVEDFRFDDGTVFDFRGERERTVNDRDGTLANSNQRAVKGFAHTYTFVISGGVIGKYKLDWMFVKSRLRDPRDEDGPRAFAPHFPRTMNDVNRALGHALSDHNPMSVDLPFEEPPDGG